jgi:SPP1 gp7 family putative phage head morphogenesis protein
MQMPTLTDKIIRHQVYLEGLKYGALSSANPILVGMEKDIRSGLVGVRSDGLGTLNKAALRKLIMTLRISILRRYNAYSDSLLKFLEAFLAVDIGHMRSIYADEPTPEPKEEDDNYAALWWPRFRSSILPANGIVLSDFVKALGPAAAIAAAQTLQRAAVNKTPLDETLAAVAALRGRMEGQTRAVLATALQSVSAQSQAAFAKIVGISECEWVSILDNRTSDICRSRSGKRYEYGKGPLPPAHPNCRSMIVPVVDGAAIPNPSFKDWVSGLPTGVRRDMFTGPIGERFEGTKAISLTAYKNKIELILMG